MRLTSVVDTEIGCFNKVKTLKHIFLEKPTDVVENDLITDICTTSLGMRNLNLSYGVSIYRVSVDGGNYHEETLETLVVRNYPRITDITLKHAEKCLKSLKYLDVTGSSCSAEQIAIFKVNRPDVTLVHSNVSA